MKKVIMLLALCILGGLSSQARAGECNGNAMLVFMPAVPDQVSFSGNYGDVVIADCSSGSAGLHRCVCITGAQLIACKYLITAQGHFELGQSGGCKLRNIDQVCWCVDEGGCSDSGSEEEPILVAPLS